MKSNTKENPLDVLEIRKLGFLPRSYNVYFLVGTTRQAQIVEEWIKTNTRGRYYIGNGVELINNRISHGTTIGLENRKEYTLFLLSCPYIQK